MQKKGKLEDTLSQSVLHFPSTGKKRTVNTIEGAIKPEDQNDKESGCNSSASLPNQKQEAAETQKSMPLPSDSTDAANAKQAQKKVVKAKPGPRRKQVTWEQRQPYAIFWNFF